ncbi:MAG: XynC protein [Chitinophagaceae bacterium BSSC1]|nr:MAG: XynC protein [Chitinophagaceae bacterium BSSC1]
MMRLIKIALFLFCMVSLAANASVDTVQFYSNSLHKQVKFVVIQPRNKSKVLIPAVYLLHGYGGNQRQWPQAAPQLQQKAEDLNMILVCPDGANSWYFDSPIDSSIRYESFVIKDLIPYVDEHYLTIPDRKHRAITGLSMGGHGGLYLAIRNQNIFGAAGSICGGVDFRPFPNNWEIKKALGEYANNKSVWDANTVMELVDGLKNNSLKLIFDCGVDDFFYPVNKALHEKLLKLKIDHDYIERPGAHNTAYWSNSIDFQLLLFKKYFDANAL